MIADRVNFGFSLLETLVATLMTSLSLLTGVYLVTRLSPQLDSYAQAESDLAAELLVIQLMKRAMRSLDSHRLPLIPMVHKGGNIRFSDGSLAPFSAGAAWDSDAISYTHLDSEQVLSVAECRVSSEATIIRGCLNASRTASFKGIENFVLVSPEGVTLAPGTVRGLGVCRTAVLFSSPSILGAQPARPLPCSVQAIVPARTLETLYLGQDGILRLVRTRGAKVIEQQPVAALPFNLMLNLRESAESNLLQLEVLLSPRAPRQARPRSFTFNSSLSRRHFLDLVFNL
jgi:hypothetical protein